jgi:DNA modification methylase
MAVTEQKITDDYAIYNGDSCEVLPTLRDESVHLSVYSPPFADLYNYSSADEDLSNCRSYEQFLEHYEFIVKEMARLTLPGRINAVHCMDLKTSNSDSVYRDFPGDIIRLHQKHGFHYQGRHCIWKEPLRIAIKTRSLGLAHRQLVKDSVLCHAAGADYILILRKKGNNPIPISHPVGLSTYAGIREIPEDLMKFKGSTDPRTNKLSHWIWQQYASSFWDDIHGGVVLPYKEAKDSEEEKHICPLQLQTIERCITLYSNPREVLLTPFLGVGSEVFCAVRGGRRGIGIELKPSYYRQAVRNIGHAKDADQSGLFDNEADDDLGDAS